MGSSLGRYRISAVVLCLGLALVAGCSDDDPPGLEGEATTGPGQEQDAEPSPGEVENTRDLAEQLCRELGPETIAQQYEVSNASDLDAVARAYSLDSTAGPRREAAYDGCLEGLERSKKP